MGSSRQTKASGLSRFRTVPYTLGPSKGLDSVWDDAVHALKALVVCRSNLLSQIVTSLNSCMVHSLPHRPCWGQRYHRATILTKVWCSDSGSRGCSLLNHWALSRNFTQHSLPLPLRTLSCEIESANWGIIHQFRTTQIGDSHKHSKFELEFGIQLCSYARSYTPVVIPGIWCLITLRGQASVITYCTPRSTVFVTALGCCILVLQKLVTATI